MAKRKQHNATFKSRVALEALRGDQTIAELAAKYEIHPTLVTKWKKQAVDGLADVFSSKGRTGQGNQPPVRDQRAHAKIGELTVERDFLAKAFGR